MRIRIVLGMLACTLGACASTEKTSRATGDFPECRKARMLCDESRGSVGFFAACAEASRQCRAARDSASAAAP